MRSSTVKRIIASLAVVLLSVAAASAANEPAFFPLLPQIMGEGGDVTASAQGFEALFTNPAGYSRSPAEFSVGATTWLYARPDRALNLALNAMNGADIQSEAVGFINTEATDGGFGVGALTGAGWSGNGLGLGAFVLVDSYLQGPNIMGVEGDVSATIGFVGGLSVPIKLGDMTLHVGGDVRPMIRIHSSLENSEALALVAAMASGGDFLSALNTADALYGLGVGFDIGAILEFWGFSAGLSVRDLLGTTFSYSQSQMGTVINSLSSTQSLPTGTAPADTYTIPMNVSAGAAYNPDLGGLKAFIDPTVQIGLGDVIGVIQDGKSPWALLHIGASAKVLSVLTVQAGLNQGYLTAGADLHLLFLDIGLAVFTRELGQHLMDRPSSGLSLDVAIRF